MKPIRRIPPMLSLIPVSDHQVRSKVIKSKLLFKWQKAIQTLNSKSLQMIGHLAINREGSLVIKLRE